MAISLKVLRSFTINAPIAGANTQLNNGAATKGWLVKRICFHNTNGSGTITLELSVSPQGATAAYLYKGYSLGPGATLLIDNDITLNHAGTGDKLNAYCTSTVASQSLNCVLDGIERDQ